MEQIQIGIIGGGQLGKMLAEAGRCLGFSFMFLEPAENPPVRGLGQIIRGSYGDIGGAARLAESCQALTVELEHVPPAVLEVLQSTGRLSPPARAIETAQDRLMEKELFRRLLIPCAEFRIVENAEDLRRAAAELGMPFLLKTRLEGYDGKGQIKVDSTDALINAERNFLGRKLIAEKIVKFDRELSIIGVRDAAGASFFYPLTENIHKDGILRQSFAPARDLSQSLQLKAENIAQKIMRELNYVGVICVELFESAGELLANEIAPRVHNSGHWTMDGANISQFENHIRAVANQGIVAPRTLRPTVMLNILGKFPSKETLREIESLQDVKIYDYLKSEAPNRKLGHINFSGGTIKAAAEKARKAIELMG